MLAGASLLVDAGGVLEVLPDGSEEATVDEEPPDDAAGLLDDGLLEVLPDEVGLLDAAPEVDAPTPPPVTRVGAEPADIILPPCLSHWGR